MSAERITWTDGHGRKVTREINLCIPDVRAFLGTPGFVWLVLAANSNLSAPDIEKYLGVVERTTPFVNRPLSWLKKRRRMFQKPGTDNSSRPDLDGNAARAVRIMSENPTVSLRNLVVLLRERGIVRSREWVRWHRCDPS